MLNKQLQNFHLILGSQSPRRHYLLAELGLQFETKVIPIDESFDATMQKEAIAMYLAEQKANAFVLQPNELLITADTIVCQGMETLNKPQSKEEAISMLQQLSGTMHEVFTGVCIASSHKRKCFYEQTEVYFHELTLKEITHYIDTCQPYDKAGAYGIQEWMGYAGIKKINGDFYNVMGLPLQKLYRELATFIVN